MQHDHMFAFESDFVASLRCVPMAVRFKLDQIGIKLSLRQWSRLTKQDRFELLTKVCSTTEELAAYRSRVVDLVALRTGEVAALLPEPASLIWQDLGQTPEAVKKFAADKGVTPPDAKTWAAISELERFVLVKLSRDNHDNVNFVPALKEFGLL